MVVQRGEPEMPPRVRKQMMRGQGTWNMQMPRLLRPSRMQRCHHLRDGMDYAGWTGDGRYGMADERQAMIAAAWGA